LRQPRNYLERTEHRRIFWLIVPPALVVLLLAGWLERKILGPPPEVRQPQVDTVVKTGLAGRTIDDAVVIEADPEPFIGSVEELSASPSALERVRDDTVFRPADEEAWFQTWMSLRSGNTRSFERAAARQVGFAELFGQPRSFRGRLVKFRGTIHRLQRVDAPANEADIREYWQAWLEPEGGPASPIVVYFLRIPPGFPTGMKINETVEVVGYFFKRWAYAAKDAVRTAPLVMSLEPLWRPAPNPVVGGNAPGSYALVTIGGLVAATLLGLRFAGRGPRRRPDPPPTDLSTSLSNVELFSPDESLRRLAETWPPTEAAAGATAPGDSRPPAPSEPRS